MDKGVPRTKNKGGGLTPPVLKIDLKGMAANRKGKRTINNIGTNYIYLQKRTELCLSFGQHIVYWLKRNWRLGTINPWERHTVGTSRTSIWTTFFYMTKKKISSNKSKRRRTKWLQTTNFLQSGKQSVGWRSNLCHGGNVKHTFVRGWCQKYIRSAAHHPPRGTWLKNPDRNFSQKA